MSTDQDTGGITDHPDLPRRSVIRGAAGLAAAGLAAGAITGAIATPAAFASAKPRPASRQERGDATPTGPVIVHIRDVSSGEMNVFAGTSHTRLTDPGLAAALLRRAR